MGLINTSASTKRNCFVSFLLFCLIELASASTANSIVSSALFQTTVTPIATTNARFNPTSLPAAVDGIQHARRTKRGTKKYGSLNYTEISKCTENSTPLDNGGSKVTKKCARQVFGNNGIKTVYGSGRTTNPFTWSPSAAPSILPTSGPTSTPTSAPTARGTSGPTTGPTAAPASAPNFRPTAGPTVGPTNEPTLTPTNPEILTSAVPNEAPGTKISSSKKAVGALVGGVLGFVALAAGAKMVETVWSRSEAPDDSSKDEELA